LRSVGTQYYGELADHIQLPLFKSGRAPTSKVIGEQTMPKKRKPPEERTTEDYQEAAENSMELAKVLAGKGGKRKMVDSAATPG
jgi:hypothetical protein